MAFALDTLIDVARQSGPDGKPMVIANVLAQTNDIILDMPWYPTNQTMTQIATLATGEPAGTWIGLNEGAGAEKPSTEQISDGCGILESWSNTDCKLADMSGNRAKFLENKDRAFIGGLGKTMASTTVYGNVATNPKAFTGFAPRYASTASGRGKDQIIKCGGTTNGQQTSIYCIQWGQDKVHGIYPKDLVAGLDYDFKGKVTINPTAGTFLDVYQAKYDWYAGLHITDYRSVVRAANIDVTNLLTAGDSTDNSANLLKIMSQMLDYLPDYTGNICFYMNKTCMSMLRVKMMSNSNTFLTTEDWVKDGVMYRRGRMMFQGYPIGRVDQILNTEDAIS